MTTAGQLHAFAASMHAIVAGTLVTEPGALPDGDWPLLACTAARANNVAALAQAVQYAGGIAAPALVPHHFFLVRLAEAARARDVLAWLDRAAPGMVHQYSRSPAPPCPKARALRVAVL